MRADSNLSAHDYAKPILGLILEVCCQGQSEQGTQFNQDPL